MPEYQFVSSETGKKTPYFSMFSSFGIKGWAIFLGVWMQTGLASSHAVILYETLIIPRPEKSPGNSPLKSGVDDLASVSMHLTMPNSTHARLLRSEHSWSQDINGFCHCPAMVAQVHLECARWGQGGSPWATHFFFLMVGVAVPGAVVHCYWRLRHLCQAWTLLDACRCWGSQSSSYQTQVLVNGLEKEGCVVLFALDVTDLMDCLVVGSLAWPAHHHIVPLLWACPEHCRFSQTCVSSMLVPSTVHAFLMGGTANSSQSWKATPPEAENFLTNTRQKSPSGCTWIEFYAPLINIALFLPTVSIYY